MESVINKRIMTFLKQKGISITALSKAINIPQATLNRQISGNSSITANTIESILTYFEDLSAEWLLRGKGEMLHLPYKPKTIVENTLERKNNRVNLMELYKLTRPYIDKEKESGVETEEQSVSGLFYDIMHNMKEMSRNYQEMNKKQQEQIDKLLDIIRTEKSRNDKS